MTTHNAFPEVNPPETPPISYTRDPQGGGVYPKEVDWKECITRFYSQWNPAKVAYVDTILAANVGRERELYGAIVKKYLQSPQEAQTTPIHTALGSPADELTPTTPELAQPPMYTATPDTATPSRPDDTPRQFRHSRTPKSTVRFPQRGISPSGKGQRGANAPRQRSRSPMGPMGVAPGGARQRSRSPNGPHGSPVKSRSVDPVRGPLRQGKGKGVASQNARQRGQEQRCPATPETQQILQRSPPKSAPVATSSEGQLNSVVRCMLQEQRDFFELLRKRERQDDTVRVVAEMQKRVDEEKQRADRLEKELLALRQMWAYSNARSRSRSAEPSGTPNAPPVLDSFARSFDPEKHIKELSPSPQREYSRGGVSSIETPQIERERTERVERAEHRGDNVVDELEVWALKQFGLGYRQFYPPLFFLSQNALASLSKEIKDIHHGTPLASPAVPVVADFPHTVAAPQRAEEMRGLVVKETLREVDPAVPLKNTFCSVEELMAQDDWEDGE